VSEDSDHAHAGPTGTILLVDSDAGVGETLAEQLSADGFGVELAHSAEHARMLATRSRPRAVLLGRLGSQQGALALLRDIREGPSVSAHWDRGLPVIVLGASANEFDMLRAFDAGADDFVALPSRYLELRARLGALLRRVEGTVGPGTLLMVRSLRIDTNSHAVSLHGLPVSLRRMEFELLVHLASDPERVFSRQELLCSVWGYRCSGSTRTLDSHASRLRRKLEDRGGRWVVNVWGVGYRLI
jgi:DNA-binding response OmpR family regulator